MRKKLIRVQRCEESRRRRGSGSAISRRGRVIVHMITGLFEEIEQIFTRNIIQHKEKIGCGFQCRP